MRKSIILIFCLVIICFKSISCCEPPDCDRLDCGTCGNACCNLEFYLKLDPSSLNEKISFLLKSGGPDKLYNFVTYTDLRPYNITASFISQGIHTTLVKRYNDTLNFAIFPLQGKTYYQSKLKAFSISQIGGAYCDQGQNYKNLIQLIKGLNEEYIESHVAGCQPHFKP